MAVKIMTPSLMQTCAPICTALWSMTSARPIKLDAPMLRCEIRPDEIRFADISVGGDGRAPPDEPPAAQCHSNERGKSPESLRPASAKSFGEEGCAGAVSPKVKQHQQRGVAVKEKLINKARLPLEVACFSGERLQPAGGHSAIEDVFLRIVFI